MNRVLNERLVINYKDEFAKILDSPFMKIPYINIWIAFLLQNEKFNAIDLPINYDRIIRIRDRALIAKRRGDRTWVKGYKGGLDVLGPWDKRAILYSSSILSVDEMQHWIRVASARGDILDKSVSCHLLSSASST